ncbi:MAG: cell division FtsA domain-containing protein [Clostridia bacterium]
MNRYTSILDIGSSKVICLICSLDAKNGMILRGAGIKEYAGFKHGNFLNEGELADAIVDAVSSAETEAAIRVSEISTGVPAPFLRLQLMQGSTQVPAKRRRITDDDIEQIINDSLDFDLPEDYELIHSTPVEFFHAQCDAEESKTRSVAASVSNVFVDSKFKRLVTAALERLDIGTDMLIGAPLAEGLFVISEAERTTPAVLIDVGAWHTEISLIKNSALAAVEVISVGGCHFTADLAYGLDLPQQVAESIKRGYVYSREYEDSADIVRLPGGGCVSIEHEAIRYIVQARMDELSGLIAKTLSGMEVRAKDCWPIYLTGGGITLVRGSAEYLESQLGMQIKVKAPNMRKLASPNYSSAFAVMNFVMEAGGVDCDRGLLNKLKNFFLK